MSVDLNRPPKYQYKREREGVRLLEQEDIGDVCRLIHHCIDTVIDSCYDREVTEMLKSLYTPSSVERLRSSENYEIWLAKPSRKISWIMSLKPHELKAEDLDLKGLEISMFYGLPNVIGRFGAKRLIDKAKDRIHEQELSYLTGTVLEPAWDFFERMSQDGKMYRKALIVTELNRNTGTPVDFSVMQYLTTYDPTITASESIIQRALADATNPEMMSKQPTTINEPLHPPYEIPAVTSV